MSRFTVVQLHKPDEKHLIRPLPFNHIVVETIQSNEWKLDVLDKLDDNGKTKVFAKLYYDEWRFDKARNFAKSLVETEYTFMLDADEVIIFGDIEKTLQSNKDCYSVQIASLESGKYHCLPVKRLAKTSIDYEGWCHEQPKVEQSYFADIIIRHTGYNDPTTNKQKAKRNADLILKSGLALTDKFQRQKLLETLIFEEQNGY